MRVMLIVKATSETESGAMPKPELMAEMGKFNQKMMDAGIWVDAAGLKPTSQGARMVASGGKRSVVHGPFAETNELIAGFWIIDVASLDEAIEWVMRSPDAHPMKDFEIDIRPFYEEKDFA